MQKYESHFSFKTDREVLGETASHLRSGSSWSGWGHQSSALWATIYPLRELCPIATQTTRSLSSSLHSIGALLILVSDDVLARTDSTISLLCVVAFLNILPLSDIDRALPDCRPTHCPRRVKERQFMVMNKGDSFPRNKATEQCCFANKESVSFLNNVMDLLRNPSHLAGLTYSIKTLRAFQTRPWHRR
jgi:hypothetical protein